MTTSKLTRTSIRRIITLIAAILFSFAVIGHQISTGFKELPLSYTTAIVSVLLSYFAKDALRNIKLTGK